MAVFLGLSDVIRAADWSLQFNGSSQYTTFGAATSTLGASTFTLECWFKRTAAGATTSTGTGGITAVPLVAKGRGEADGNNKDCNYFFGITSANVLGADFEEGAGQTSPGLNHPISGSTVIVNDRWYHAAVTFDGTTWRLYLDGALDGTLDLGANRGPRSDSIQHAAIASALTSTGAAAGFFAGRIDEVRIWNVARTQAEILASMRAKVPSASGLLGRWSLDEGTGTTIASSAGTTVNGTLTGTPTWNIDSPFTVVAVGSTWKYLDNGSDQGTAWRSGAFNDAAWLSGPAELGYGDGGEATVVGYGADANNKYPTTYFRHTFTITDASRYNGLDVSLVRDDGAVVYLNGVEVLRSNMPTGDILYNTYAASPEVSGTDESKWFNFSLPTAAFVEGPNTVAVEVHQQRAASSDISFNLKLAASRTDTANPPPTVALTAPAAASLLPTATPVTLSASASDDGSVAKVEFFANGTKLGETLASPFDFAWTPATPGRMALTAKATDNQGATTTSTAVNTTVYEAGTGAVQFDGVNDHVTFGQAVSLGVSNLTVECWMRKLGTGLTSSSGNGGITAVPLVTKGRGEAEGSNVDCNYFFGILPSGALAADFEQFYADGGAAGQNYPVTGTSTAAGDGAWHHVAVTYDGSTWVLYLDGAVDKTLTVGNHTPRWDSIQHAGIGVAMTSTGATEGAFEGLIDEVRIWNYARSAGQLASAKDFAIPTADGLVGRWSLDEASGTAAATTVSAAPAGTLVNGPIRCSGLTLGSAGEMPPSVALTSPVSGALLAAGTDVTLVASAHDDDGSVVSVAFLNGDTELGSATAEPFTLLWTAVPVGAHALKAVATDNHGHVVTSAVVTVTATVRNDPPAISALAPVDGASIDGAVAPLQATVTDPEGLPSDVRVYGRVRTQQPPAADFTLAVLPDTQFYSQTYPATFVAQTDWVVAQRTARNIFYVAHLGDIVQDGDTYPAQWVNASNAMARLENPVTTGLPHGIPYGIGPGNHDHVNGTTLFNQYFGVSHFADKPWYGGHMGSDNQNHYDLVSAGGMDFIFIYTDWNYASLTTYAEEDAWVHSLLQAYPSRRAVLVRHAIINTSGVFDGTDDAQNFFNTVKGNTNLFLMLNGHYHGEAQRTETVDGRRIDICLSDYQSYANGGNGFLRLYEFSPSNNVIRVKTYSPTLDQYETDANSQFEIPYTMASPADTTPYMLLASTNAMVSGGTLSHDWNSLSADTTYEWYAEATDGSNTNRSAVRTFATSAAPEPVVNVSNPYADVDWATVGTFKGNLHTHSTNSDGTQAPAAVIDGYAAQNYDVLAMTDHDFVTYPWSTYGRDPATVGLLDIQGNELSSAHHIVSLFSGYANTSANETTMLTGVGTAGGLAFFAHPGRYTQTAQWYADHYLAQPHCIGQEIYNQGDRYTGDRVKWDQVLSILMPGRPVWGFSNDDSHQASHIGKNRTYLLSPSVSQANVRTALEAGAFFATYSTSSAYVPPMLTNVVVNAVAGTITVQGTGYTQVRWISQGTQVATGETLDLIGTPGVAKYVRAELHGAEGIAYSNPFGLLPTGNQPPTVSAGSNQSVSLVAGATLNGSASDDGLPNPPAALTLLWEQVGGQGTATFANASAAQTTVSFSVAGTYVLRLTASDGTLSASAEVTITVQAPAAGNWTAYNDCSPGSGQLTANITTFGIASPTSGTLVDYATGNPVGVTLQVVNNGAIANGTGGPMPNSGTDAYDTFNGKVSFANVAYYGPVGWYVDAVVTGLDPSRRYEFATSVNRGETSYTDRWSKFTISGVDAATQASTSGVQVNTETSVSFWAGYNSANGHVARWTEIRPGADGSFTVRAEADGQSGHNTQKAYAFDGILLRDLGPSTPGNQAPTVSAGADQTITLPATATLVGSASDDGLPNPPAALTLLWEQVGGQGTASFADAAAAQTTVSFSVAGTYVLRLTASDGTLSASAEVTITVQAPAAGNWTAYNDCSPGSGQLTANITTFGIASPTSGTLVDYATGNPVGVTLQVVNNPSAPANANGTGGPMPNAGTDAYDTFNGKVSFANVIWYGNTGWWVDAIVSGLDPAKEYEFATSVNRGSSSYTTRWSKFTISSIDSAEQSSTSGVQVNSDTSVSFWAGYNNVNGHVARWTKIKCGADGSFKVRAEADGQLGHATREAYAFDGILLRETSVGPAPLSVALTAPANGQTFANGAMIAMQAATSGVATAAVTNVLFRADGNVVGEDAHALFACNWTGASAGTHNLDAVALLDDGSSITSGVISITVNQPVNQPPAVPTLVSPADTATGVTLAPNLTVDVNDADNATLSVTFYGRAATNTASFTALGTNVAVVAGTQTSVVWPGLTANTDYEWYATVSDGTNTTTGPVATFTTLSPFTVTATAGANGTVTPATALVVPGGSTNFTITAANYYRIADVRTNGVSIGGPFGMSALVYTWNGVAADGTLVADFVQNLAPSGTPEAWLAQYGLTVGEESMDTDGDKMTAREEYVAGTDPSNANSVLKITSTANGGVSGFGMQWPSVAGRVYDVEHSTNLLDTLSFQPLLTDIKATPSTNSCVVPLFPDGPHFFRLKVRLAQ